MRTQLLSVVLFLSLITPAWASCPSRTYTYTTGQTIDPSQVTTNEDSLFTYGCAVDTFATGSVNAAAIADGAVATGEILDGTIVNADVSSTAAITYGKLSFSNNIVAGDIASGAVDAGDMATTGTIADDKVFVADSATAATWRTITNCTDTGGNHLNYTQSTNSFSCGTSSASTDVGGTNAVRVHRTAGDITTTSTSLVDLTGATATITTAANPVLVGFACDTYNSGAGGINTFNIDVDGSLVLGTSGIQPGESGAANQKFPIQFTAMTAALTAASHTIKIQWKVGAGTGTVVAGTAEPCNFWVTEVVD